MNAIKELKNQLATFSIEVAEKILEKELSKDKEQKDLINKWVDEVKFN